MSSSYRPAEYWNQRLAHRPNLVGTGHRQFSLAYNIKMYEIATERLFAALTQAGVSLAGQRVLDIGPGFGYFVDRFLAQGVAQVTGVDLAAVAIDQLQHVFPGQVFVQGDVSEASWSLNQNFDLVSAISVIFHIVDDAHFKQAIGNLCRHVRPGGHLLIVDAFRQHRRPLAAHARLRDLEAYQPLLDHERFEIVGLYPMYHWMSRTYIPLIGPALLSRPPFLDWLVRAERRAGQDPRRTRGVLNYLIARRLA